MQIRVLSCVIHPFLYLMQMRMCVCARILSIHIYSQEIRMHFAMSPYKVYVSE